MFHDVHAIWTLFSDVLDLEACVSGLPTSGGTILLTGPRGPLLLSVLQGGIACIRGLPVAPRGPADEWMLSLEPFSSYAERASRPRRLLERSAYALSVELLCLFGSYSSWCFHIDSTVAAMRRASVSLARLGRRPAATIRW